MRPVSAPIPTQCPWTPFNAPFPCSEDTKVSHYIINRIPAAGPNQFMYRIGDQTFQDLPELLGFYKLHYLDTTALRRPAKKIFERVICKFDFKAGVSVRKTSASDSYCDYYLLTTI